MARIAGVNIPQNKLVHVGLTYIFGVGNKFSSQICKELSINKTTRPVLDFYAKNPNFHDLDGTLEIDEITKKIDDFLNV